MPHINFLQNSFIILKSIILYTFSTLSIYCMAYQTSKGDEHFHSLSGKIGLVPTRLMDPPDVKIETTFFQRNFFSTIPCNYPQKQHKKRTSDLSEVPILRCFLKILPLSASLPASYQIPPDCTPNGIFPSNDTSFLYPIRTFSISFAALAHC